MRVVEMNFMFLYEYIQLYRFCILCLKNYDGKDLLLFVSRILELLQFVRYFVMIK